METFLTIVIGIVLIDLVVKSISKSSVHQLRINIYGFNKIPSVLLELANIQKDKETSYKDLTKQDLEKFSPVYKNLEDAVDCMLTYVDSHDLIHVQKSKYGHFHKISENDRYIIMQTLGKLKSDKELYYVMYRKNNGWFKGSILIGYLLKRGNIGDAEEVTRLFEFPERLVRWGFFTKGLIKKYNLEENTIADYIDKDELGYARGIYSVSYETKDKDKTYFNFDVDI